VLVALCTAAILVAAPLSDARAAVTLVRFEASWQDDGTILVEWETSSELDSMAFFLYRGESQDVPRTDYIDFEPAAGNQDTGANYSFVDDTVTQGVTYYYLLEEVDASNNSTWQDPITPSAGPSEATATATTTATRSATSRPTATGKPGQGSNPTATRQYTNTPASTGAGTSSPTQTRSPAGSAPTAQAASTRSSGLMVTTPTPVGGAPVAEAPSPTPEMTATPEAAQPEPTVQPTAVETPILQPTQPAPTPTPTIQRVVVAPKETSQPLLDASATLSVSAPAAKAPPNNGAGSRLALLLGVGALATAAILGALALLILRRRGR
jgi:hypothetical protein